MRKRIFLISAAILLCLAFSTAVFAENYGIVIVTDSSNGDVNKKTAALKKAVMHKGKGPKIKTYNFLNPDHIIIIERKMNLSRKDLPFIGLAVVDSKGYFKSFVKNGAFRRMGNPSVGASKVFNLYYSKVPKARPAPPPSKDKKDKKDKDKSNKSSKSDEEKIEALIKKNVEYLCPESNKRTLTEADLKGRSAVELTVMRNEIFARHGRAFNDEMLSKYFNSRKWYKTDDSFSPSQLSETEQANAKFIQVYQHDNGLIW